MMVEQWNNDVGTVEQIRWNSETMMVEQWNSDSGIVEE